MFFIIISMISLILFLYPYYIYPFILNKIALTKNPLNLDDTKKSLDLKQRSFSLMFCAYNEEKSLPEKLKNLRELKSIYYDLEILAYSDCSEDKTWELLKSASDILTPIKGIQRLGKAAGMQKLVKLSRGEILIFTDANVIIDKTAIGNIHKYFNIKDIGTIGGTLKYVNSLESTTSTVGGFYWELEEKIKFLESSTGSTIGSDGSLFAIRRHLYPFIPCYLLDDFIASINPIFFNYRVISTPDVIAYEKLTVNTQDEFKRKKRIACRAFNTHRYLWPEIKKLKKFDVFKYISHKILKWLGGFILIISQLSLSIGLFLEFSYVGFFYLVLFYIFIFLTLIQTRKLFMFIEIIKALTATSIGIVESLLGKKYQTWNPPTSRN